MCGIAGFFESRGIAPDQGRDFATRMSAALRHRGPDDAGIWVDCEAGVALAHRRLAIVDLSSAGHQPMTSRCGRYVIAYNGEIYNHRALRRELEKGSEDYRWHGHSDTETLLAAIVRWGIEPAITQTVGMFALALWDRKDRKLTLVRDRLGEKPLYYGWVGSSLVFGSELKALRAHPKFDNKIDRNAVSLYVDYNYVPTPWSIYERVWKLPAGTSLEFTESSPRTRGEPQPYWSARQVAVDGLSAPFNGDDREAEEELGRLLEQSVAGQMEADVPVAAFLSGGIDSSAVVAVMQSLAGRPVRTFSIGFHEASHNEAEHAARVARHLGTDHTELYVAPGQALDVVPSLPDLYDEPFGDSSQVPTFLMTHLTRQHVTVALSGDGGDELFGGYNRYLFGMKVWRRLSVIPRVLRHAGAAAITAMPISAWDRLISAFEVFVPKRFRYSTPGEKLHKIAQILDSAESADIYRRLVSLRWPATTVHEVSKRPETSLTDPAMWLSMASLLEQMMFLDLVTYLTDDILVKVDRAAMGTSLETRVPMLDHRLVEFAWRLPATMKVRAGTGKYLLKRFLYRRIPEDLVDRPKMGFGVPIDSWLRGPLRDWADSLLSRENLEHQGFLDADIVRRRWAQHLNGAASWHYDLWNVLMFQAWLERWKPLPNRSQPAHDPSAHIEMAGPSAH